MSALVIKTTYTPEANALFVSWASEGTQSVRTEEVAPNVLLDFDADGNAIAIEVLNIDDGKRR